MTYYVVEYVDGPQGAHPPIPDGVGFMTLAGPVPDSRLALIESAAGLGNVVSPIPDGSAAAIDAAKAYPPALAAAREGVADAESTVRTPETLMAAYLGSMQRALAARGADDWVPGVATVDELGYLRRGEAVWVRSRLSTDGRADWVSSDYFVYRNPASDFDLSKPRG
jgi:hypothetical protein